MADKKLKRKYQQAPKEKKYSLIAFPFAIIMVILAILSAVGLGLVPLLIGIVICLCGVLIPLVFAKKEHKKWVEEGNKEYRYYDPDTGLEVDENGNPLPEGGEAPQKPAPVQEPQIQEPNLPEPDENGDIEEPAPVEKPQPQAEQAPKQQPAKYEAPYVEFARTVLPIIAFGLFALVALLRTIMFIRDMVYYIQNNTYFLVQILNAVRIIGPAILLAVIIISMVKYFKEKQKVEQAFVALLKIAFLSAIIGIVGLVYQGAAFLYDTYTLVDLLIQEEGSLPPAFVKMFIENFVIILFYVAFDIALIVFYKIALKTKVDSIKSKIFAVMPFGIMFAICIMFMIVTSIGMPGMAPGFYVTASIIMLACAAVGCIPFLVKFKDEPLDAKAAAAAPIAAAGVAPVAASASAPKAAAQPQKKNDNSGDPEVKSNKKGLIIILIVVAALVLCGGGGVGVYFLIKNANNQNREDGPSDDDSSYYSSSSSKSSSKSSSSSSKPSSSSARSYTPVEVISEIDRLNTGSATHYYLEGDIYYLGISYGSTYAVEANLKAAVTNLDMPSYLTARSDPYSGTWNDGAKGYFQYLDTPKKDVTVYIGSYIMTTDEGDDLVAQIAVYKN